jgi:signal transduction histidine kinase
MDQATTALDAERPTGPRGRPVGGRLFYKYAALFVAVVFVALITNGAFEAWFTYQEVRTFLIRIQREKAAGAAEKIGQFIKEIERQVGWTTHLPWSPGTTDQHQFDGQRLLRQVPAITELSQLDSSGREQLRVSRLAMDVIGSQIDFSKEPKFIEAVAKKVYFGPVYFRQGSEPYMTLSVAGARRDAGVSVAEVNLRLIWEIVAQIKVGELGRAYVVDARGRLIAHPDISLVLRNTDMSRLAQVRAAQSKMSGTEELVPESRDLQGRLVLTAHAAVPELGWFVFVELPVSEAYAPLYTSMRRSGLLLLTGLIFAVLASLFLARRMVIPIQTLGAGAARIGAGDLSQRIAIKTGDEIETLANQFNDMAGRLEESYADLEKKVESRTKELAQSLAELRALGEVGQALNSTLDLKVVLNTIVTKAVQLSGADAGAIYVREELQDDFRLRATQGMSDELIRALSEEGVDSSEPTIRQAAETRAPVQIFDLLTEPISSVRRIIIEAGFRALLVVPLLRPEGIVGLLVVRRKEPGEFPREVVEVLQTFATQSVLAIQNARLFSAIEVKGRQLEIASRHKSQFLANMSHELRTPLNAILGYTELILDGIYGEVPQKAHAVLERVQRNGKHLLGLINDVLDLSKIEAGQLQLSVAPYSLRDVVHNVFGAVESLANEKKLALNVEMPRDLPAGVGDALRLTQVLLNLVGNAIKFTDQGQVTIKASAVNGSYTVAVCDTGPGIPTSEQERIFDEFQQADNSITKEKGGTGLGLAIARKIIEMHGGRIWVESSVGSGATFSFTVPVVVEHQRERT